MDAKKEFGRTVLSLDNCIIPRDLLENTPSFKDGVSRALETDLRVVGCEYIQSSGLLLKLPQVAMATAQVLFQRFYYSKSFVKFSFQPTAMACIFLAAKIEEDCRRIRDIINVFQHLKQKRRGRPVVPMEYMGEDYFKLKNQVIKFERFILKELGFCVHVKHPHKLIITYLQFLEMEKNKQLAQRAWNLMNDTLRTNVFVKFTPETIACACIFLAARQLQIALPQRPPWWLLFDVNYEDVESISVEVLALYKRPKVFLDDLEKQIGQLRDRKHVEIKEIHVRSTGLAKVSSSNLSPRSAASPAGSDPLAGSERDRSSSRSPAPLLKANSLQLPSRSGNRVDAGKAAPVRAPSRDRSGSPQSYSSSHSPTPPRQQPSSSPPSDVPHPHRTTPLAYQTVYSPIKMSPESGSDVTPSPATASHENGIYSRFGRDADYDRKVRHERHRHSRREKRSHHHRHRRDGETHRHRREGEGRSRERDGDYRRGRGQSDRSDSYRHR